MESLRASEAELEISIIASRENSFSRFTRQRKVVELRVVISANINLGFAVILSPKWSLYDLQKLRYGFCDNRNMAENGFSRFTRKRKVIELRALLHKSAKLGHRVACENESKVKFCESQG